MATPEYFKTMGIPVIAGRAFTDDDREGGAPVVIISRALARQSFPDRDPLGKYLLVRDSQARFRPLQIVGVAGDVRHTSLEAEAEPHVYLPYHQTNPTCSSGSPTTSSSSCARRARPRPREGVRRELQAVDSTVAAADIRASGYYLDNATAARRFSLELLAGFAGWPWPWPPSASTASSRTPSRSGRARSACGSPSARKWATSCAWSWARA
jgi:hypothetical protein